MRNAALRHDYSGERSGRLSILWPAGRTLDSTNTPRILYAVQCDCGKVIILPTKAFWNQITKSCGCLKDEVQHSPKAHGHTRLRWQSPEYTAYHKAKDRCTNPNNRGYRRYGGRGIAFRFTSFEEFLAHIGPKPNPGLSLDRINNDGHYEIGNVRWATTAEQHGNKTQRTANPSL